MEIKWDKLDNNYETALESSITSSNLVIPLNAIPTNATRGFLTIDADDAALLETIYFETKGAGIVTCPATGGRGQAGTSAQAHDAGAIVKMYVLSEHVESLKDKTDELQDDIDNIDIPAASTVERGIVELATITEATAGVDSKRAVTPAGLRALAAMSSQGEMKNGKIDVTVASNNITVAIKTMDGSAPSATNPVSVRIGNNIRLITSALSVTKDAGTNWFNAGSDELKTQEIDYFVYLGYNSADGVVIGFAPIPYARQYDEFSTTTTNDKHCAISTITNANATDNYENVGRFAATLSAGTAYTWTVPTFTPKNLIQERILETRGLDWLPAYTGAGSMSYTSVTTSMAKYQIVGRVLSLRLYCNGTTGGTATNGLIFTFPKALLETQQYLHIGSCGIVDAGDISGVLIRNSNTNSTFAFKYNKANFGLGTERYIRATGSYEV